MRVSFVDECVGHEEGVVYRFFRWSDSQQYHGGPGVCKGEVGTWVLCANANRNETLGKLTTLTEVGFICRRTAERRDGDHI
jgi:hypothetical protein